MFVKSVNKKKKSLLTSFIFQKTNLVWVRHYDKLKIFTIKKQIWEYELVSNKNKLIKKVIKCIYMQVESVNNNRNFKIQQQVWILGIQ